MTFDYKSANAHKYRGAQRSRWEKSPEKQYFIEKFRKEAPSLVGKGDVILDNGGGPGHCTDMIRELGITDRIYAVDIAPAVLKERDPRDICAVGDMEALPYPDHHFDRVLFIAALHHVYDTKKALDQAWRVLKPGGRVVLKEPISLRLLLKGIGIRRSVSDPAEFAFSLPHVLRNLRGSGFRIETLRYHGFIQRFLPKNRLSLLRIVDGIEEGINRLPAIRHAFGLLADYGTIVARKPS